MKFPTVTLKNGLVVANFSSNHSKFNPNSNVAFTFDDGSTLENVSMSQMKALSLDMVDEKIPSVCGRFSKVIKGFRLTETIKQAVDQLRDMNIDLVIVSFPMLKELNSNHENGYSWEGFVTCIVDRATGICSSTEFGTL